MIYLIYNSYISLIFLVILNLIITNYEVKYKSAGLFSRGRIIRCFDAYELYFQGTTDAQKQQQLSEDAIDGIIAGVICFCSLVVVIIAIVTQRRPCDRGWFSQG